jgi:hypothetical protein
LLPCSMHRPGYVQGGQEANIGYLLLGVYYRRIPGETGIKRYHLDLMLSSGTTCYHLGLHVIIWDAMLSSGANVIMVSSGANVIIWCYHVMLSSGMITHPFFIFPENFTHSNKLCRSTSI